MGLITPNAQATRVVLSVTAMQQQGTYWCWAACSRMMAVYRSGSSESQSWITSNYSSRSDGGGSYDAHEANNFLSYKNYGQSYGPYDLISYTSLQRIIQTYNKPIFSVLENGGGMAYLHAVLIRGYDTSTSYVLYIDPSDGLGHGITYSRFCDGIKFDNNFSRWAGYIY